MGVPGESLETDRSPATPLLLPTKLLLLLLLRLAFGALDFSLPLPPDQALPAVSLSLSMNLLADRRTGIANLWCLTSPPPPFSPEDAIADDVGAELDDKVNGVADHPEGELCEAIVVVSKAQQSWRSYDADNLWKGPYRGECRAPRR